MPVIRADGALLPAALLLASLAGCAATATHDGTELAQQRNQRIVQLADEADEACRRGQPERAAGKILQRTQLTQLNCAGAAGAPVSQPFADGYYYAALAKAFHGTAPICDLLVPNLSKLAISYLQDFLDRPAYPESRITLDQRAAAYALMSDRVGEWAGLKPQTLAAFSDLSTRLKTRAEE